MSASGGKNIIKIRVPRPGGRTPLPAMQPALGTANPRPRPPPVRDEDIDHTKVPIVPSADGVILIDGKYRCNGCGNKMKNVAATIRSHNSKLHPKNPRKPSAYMKRIARNPTPCRECDKVCTSMEMLAKHIRSAHPKEKSPKEKAPEQNAPEENASEEKSPEEKSPEEKSPEQNASEEKSSEETSSETSA
ncbi:hypothetical protein F4859DRAFT_512551 [Xylaria cf. heliscus]|nr:hypothetical protein F4859DRAFT_512551 [Xylaria cf. heliscus]